MKPFVHLHLHTEYSLVDSVVRIGPLMSAVADQGMPAVALTDQSNLFALVKFYRSALARGVKPLIGLDLLLADEDDPQRPSHLVLLCQNRAGYRNLTRLVTRTYLDGQYRGVPMARREWLDADTTAGLIALSGGIQGDIGRAVISGREDLVAERSEHWARLFPDRFYLEVTRTGRPGEDACLAEAVRLGDRLGLPLVATNDVRFLAADDYDAHEARVCIHQGRTLEDGDRPQDYSDRQYLRSAEEMAELFADLPEALANSVEIARRCNVEMRLGESFLPEFPVPVGRTTDEHLRLEAAARLEKKLAAGGLRGGSRADYEARLERELEVICSMGFPGYFLIVADFIRWARENGVPVGPGRGSGAGSLVAWVLGITDLDPLEHDLLFERFLNPERVSMPDFDVDFCMEGRDRVIDYVAERYGRDQVSQIITYGTMAAKAVVRDAGRVLGHPYGFVDRIAKLIPFELGITLDKALEQEPELAQLCRDDEEVRGVIDLARKLEGLVRNAGKHAGGVVIAPTTLTDFAPLYCEEGGHNVVTQFDKDDVEAAGLVKFDFLGLRTLTVIDRAVANVNAERARQDEPAIDISEVAMDDAQTFELLRACRTTAVFQLESRGMKDLIKRLQPDSFEDLVALVALFRPGPLQSGMVDDFIARKHGDQKAVIDYLHPDLEPVLKPTYGVILYQEQVMQIAQVLAGYTLGGADLLRRAMGKKKPEEMAKQREVFVSGAEARGVETATATRIFDLMEKFAGYGFNKSHSAAYAVLSYQTAWLKAHYPAAFMAAVMSTDMDHTDKLVSLKDDCREMGIEIEPPDVNRSDFVFGVSRGEAIRYGLGAIKGVGRGAVESIVAEREANGPYRDLMEFCRRADLERVNRRTLEALVKAGAMDGIGANRRTLMTLLPEAVKSAEQEARASAAGQDDLFGLPTAAPPRPMPQASPQLAEWNEQERLAAEKESLGLYLTGHPFHSVAGDARHFTSGTLRDITSARPPSTDNGERDYSQSRREVVVAGLIIDIRKRGNRVTVVLDDDTGRIETSLFSEAFMENRHLLVKDRIIVVEGRMRYDEFIDGWTVVAKTVRDIDRVIEERARHLVLSLDVNGSGREVLNSLHEILLPYRSSPGNGPGDDPGNGAAGGRGGRARCDVAVQYVGSDATVRLNLGEDWCIRPTRDLRDKLEDLLGRGGVRLVYAADQASL
ncbi:DNA polymerase III subunit alpha [Lentisalinibacter salinarum]|uniref:DNA polymerase III subunit alpha n=1 Tax=Lentisalinibacter salinarum TaxID=2992239 RepID=UPI0038674394